MHLCKKIAIATVLLVSLFGCGEKSETVFLEKDGTLYEVADQVSFYYPKNFQLDTSSDNKEVVNFIKNQETLSYTTIKDDTDNKIEDMPALFAGQLEEDGASQVGYKNLKIDSGLNCQEFTGTYKSTGMKFKDLVYFTSEASYDIHYQAPEKIYDENIAMISKYLSSLTVHHE